MNAIDAIRAWRDELDARRRDFHGRPELSLETHRRSSIVAKKLEELGIEVHRHIGSTGVVGVLKKASPTRLVAARRWISD